MAFYKSKNPALGSSLFEKSIQSRSADDGVMTLESTVNKCIFLGLVVFGFALITWYLAFNPAYQSMSTILMGVGGIGGFIVALIIIFKKRLATYMATVYAALEGLFLGAISAYFEMAYQGIVAQAIILTMGVLFSLLALYKFRIIKVTENFKMIVVAATGGIALIYLLSFIGGFFGLNMPFIHEGGTFGIVFSIVVVIVAALNLVMDFDFIEEGSEKGAPKYMEWYAAFGLMVTLIWLYLEILRLLSKLRRD
ncbi:MAG TPA: hypothetical protein DDY13_18460 [Cytophagales bacterium]|jgi:uncharacterized YccA/Bax inhibitor family protein|nr:hypothetical protein [Cytophagales bacterium]